MNIEAIRDHALEGEVGRLYSEKLAYHNFQHALTTLVAAENILSRCVAEGIRVDPRVVYYALLFHDAGYCEDHLRLGYSSKEAYSAALACDTLTRFGIGSRILKKVELAILGTHREATVVTAEQKLVRAADLSGLAADYAIFLDNTRRLWREHQYLSNTQVSWATWLTQAAEHIKFYLTQEIRLTSYFVNEAGESAFHAAVRANLQRLLVEQI